jgi:hypothetical protein
LLVLHCAPSVLSVKLFGEETKQHNSIQAVDEHRYKKL